MIALTAHLAAHPMSRSLSQANNKRPLGKFVADPSLLFGGLVDDESGGSGFDQDTGLSAYVVRLGIVFLDGVRVAMDRRRVGGVGGVPGEAVLEALGGLVESAKGDVGEVYMEKMRRLGKSNIELREGEENEDGGGVWEENEEGGIGMVLIQRVKEFSEANPRDKISPKLVCCLLRAHNDYTA